MAIEKNWIDQTTIESNLNESKSDLARRVQFSSISHLTILWLFVFLVGVTMRLIGRTSWPLSEREAQLASGGLVLVNGGNLSEEILQSPMAAQITGIMIFLFGPTDTVVRLPALIAGIFILLIPFLLREAFGERAMLGTTALLAISPTMVFTSSRIDGASLLLVPLLAILLILIRSEQISSPISSAGIGALAASALLIHPVGWILVPLVLISGVLFRGEHVRPRTVHLPAIGLSLLATIVISGTFGMTRPGVIVDFFEFSLTSLVNDYILRIGHGWHLAVTAVITNEILIITLVVVAIAALAREIKRKRSTINSSLYGSLFWVSGGALVTIGLSGAEPGLLPVLLFPLAITAGSGAARLLQMTFENYESKAPAVGFIIVTLLMIAGLVRAWDHTAAGPSNDPVGWSITVIALFLFVLTPLVYFGAKYSVSLNAKTAPLIVISILLLLSVISIRNAMLVNATIQPRSGEVLLHNATAPGLKFTAERVKRISRDLSATERDARNPEGGFGLAIAIDDEFPEPFNWYFRDFPERRVLPANEIDVDSFDVAIITSDNSIDINGSAGVEPRVNVHTRRLPQTIQSPDWGSMLRTAVNPLAYRDLGTFMFDKETVFPNEQATYALYLSDEVASRGWGVSQNEP